MAATPLNNTAIISLFDKGGFLNPLAWLVAFHQVSVWTLFLLPAKQRRAAIWLIYANLMPNASVHLPDAVVIDWSNVMLHRVYFYVGILAPNALLRSWDPYQCAWTELLLPPIGACGLCIINHIASLCFKFELWEGWKGKEGFHFLRSEKMPWPKPPRPAEPVGFWWSQQRHLQTASWSCSEGWSPSLLRQDESAVSISRLYFFSKLTSPVMYL